MKIHEIKYKLILSLLAAMTLVSPMNIAAKNTVKDEVYYKDGQVATSTWVEIDDKWYYTDSNGNAAKNKWIASGSNWFKTNENGEMIANQWLASTGSRWYYMDTEGRMATFPLFIDGKLTGFNEDGTWQRDAIQAKGIPLSISGNYKQEVIEGYLEQLKVMPYGLTKNVSKLIFSDEFQKNEGNFSFTAGLTMWEYGKTAYDVRITGTYFVQDAILHEFIHALDGVNQKYSENSILESQSVVDEIGTQSRYKKIEERLAYMTVSYFRDKTNLLENYPITAGYLQDLYNRLGIDIPKAYFDVKEEDINVD